MINVTALDSFAHGAYNVHKGQRIALPEAAARDLANVGLVSRDEVADTGQGGASAAAPAPAASTPILSPAAAAPTPAPAQAPDTKSAPPLQTKVMPPATNKRAPATSTKVATLVQPEITGSLPTIDNSQGVVTPAGGAVDVQAPERHPQGAIPAGIAPTSTSEAHVS